MPRETVQQYGSIVDILDGPAVASGHSLAQWSPKKESDIHPYHEVKAASQRVSGVLQELGVEQSDRVIIWGPNSPQWVMSGFGVLRTGAVSVPFDVNADTGFLDKVIELAEPKAIIAGSDQRELLPRDYGIPVIEMEKAHEIHPHSMNDYQDADVSGRDLAQIVFTSGSTGNPKGVMLSHGGIDWNVKALTKEVNLSPDNRLLSLLPQSHMFEFNPGMLTPMYLGASVVYTDTRALRARPENLMRAMNEEKITGMAVVPEVLKIMKAGVEHNVKKASEKKQKMFRAAQKISALPIVPNELRRKAFHELHEKMGGDFRYFLVGGSHLDPELGDYWEHLGVNVLQGYGMTEASPVVSVDSLHGRRDHEYVGYPLDGVELRLEKVDEESDATELWVRSPGIMMGYYKNEAATREVLTEDGWYKTRDIVEIDKKGRLQIKGRNDFMISLPDGHNVFPEDVEQTILRHNEGVLKNAMIYEERVEDKVRIHAVLFPAPSAEVNAEEVMKNTNKHLADWQRIRGVQTWPDGTPVPETATRKLKRKEVLKEIKK